MKLLLDTHALLWWLDDDPRLAAAAADLIESADSEIIVSIVSLWEIAIKHRLGKLQATAATIAAAADASGFRLLAIALPHLATLARLPTHHRDPFDHLLIAQAMVEDATLVTADHVLAAYPVTTLAC